MEEISIYQDLLYDIKVRVCQGQIRANLSAYWDIGKMIHLRQQAEGWGATVIPRLTVDLLKEI